MSSPRAREKRPILQEVIEEFLTRLKDSKVPNLVIEKLKRLLEGREKVSQAEIFEIVKEGCEGAPKDKED